MIIQNLPNYCLLGIDCVVTNDTATEKRIFTPFPNDDRLQKNDLTVKFENIYKTYSHEFEIPALTWDMPFEFDKIDILMIKAECEASFIQPDFSIKLESATNAPIDIREFLCLPFSSGISKFYISNPLQYKLSIKLVYLTTKDTTSKINSRLYKKSDALLYTNIKHNLGIIPIFFFLNEQGEKITPDYTIISEDKNQLRLSFTTLFNGFIVLDYYYTHDQLDNSLTWTIEHNLDKYPSVMAFNEVEQQIDFEINYESQNKIVLTFIAPTKGRAIIY